MSSIHAVTGYIRKVEASLKSHSDETLFQTIPGEIKQIIASFWMNHEDQDHFPILLGYVRVAYSYGRLRIEQQQVPVVQYQW